MKKLPSCMYLASSSLNQTSDDPSVIFQIHFTSRQSFISFVLTTPGPSLVLWYAHWIPTSHVVFEIFISSLPEEFRSDQRVHPLVQTYWEKIETHRKDRQARKQEFVRTNPKRCPSIALPSLQLSILANFSCSNCSIPKTKMSLLWKFILSPESYSKL